MVFLGDSVLDMIVTDMLYRSGKELQPWTHASAQIRCGQRSYPVVALGAEERV